MKKLIASFIVGVFSYLLLSGSQPVSAKSPIISKNSKVISSVRNESYTYNLQAGHNFIAITLVTRSTAKGLCNNYENVTKVSRWDVNSQTWKEYDCATGTRQDNFGFLPNISYMITTDAPQSVTFRGTTPGEYGVTFQLGWNAVGIPNAETYDLQAEEICGNLVGTNYQVAQVNRFVNGGWNSHLCSGYYGTPPSMNNFDIQTGVGYLLEVVEQ